MRYALISNFHSDLPALGIVPTDIDLQEDVDARARVIAIAEDGLDGLTGRGMSC